MFTQFWRGQILGGRDKSKKGKGATPPVQCIYYLLNLLTITISMVILAA